MKCRFILSCIIISVIIFIVSIPTNCIAAPNDNTSIDQQIIDEQINDLDLSSLNKYYQALDYTEQHNVLTILKDIITGRAPFNMAQMAKIVLNLFFKEIMVNFGLLIQILAITIITGILNQMQSSLENKSVGEIAFYACYALVVIIIIQSFKQVMDYGSNSITDMVLFMQAFLPTMYGLLISSGAVTGSIMFQPLMATMVSLIGTFIKDIAIPILFFSAVLMLIDNISDKVPLNKLSELLRNISTWILSLLFIIFSSVSIVQGIASGTFDSVSVRTAKFAVGNFIPVVGGMLSDSFNTILSYTLLVKNAVGLVGLIVLVSICIMPALKILAIIFMYRVSAALIEPIAESRIPQCLSDISKIMMLLFISVLSVAVMFFIAIALLIGANSISMIA